MNTTAAINLNTKGWIVLTSEFMRKSNPDNLINAWEIGVNRGLNLKDDIINKYFVDKMNKSTKAATKLFEILNEKIQVNCKDVFIRINDINDFDILYLFDINSYLSDKLHKSYNEALTLKKELRKEDVKFNFIFKPLTENTNVENIFADGYVLKYAPKSRKA